MLKIKINKQFQTSETQKELETILMNAKEIIVSHQFDKRPISFITLFLGGASNEDSLRDLLSEMVSTGKIVLN